MIFLAHETFGSSKKDCCDKKPQAMAILSYKRCEMAATKRMAEQSSLN